MRGSEFERIREIFRCAIAVLRAPSQKQPPPSISFFYQLPPPGSRSGIRFSPCTVSSSSHVPLHRRGSSALRETSFCPSHVTFCRCVRQASRTQLSRRRQLLLRHLPLVGV